MKLIHRLWLLIGTYILLSFLSGIIVFIQLNKVVGEINHLAVVSEPLEKTILEMEINVNEAFREVVDYMRDRDPSKLQQYEDSISDFESFYVEFKSLAESKKEKDLGEQAFLQFNLFKTKSNNIAQFTDQFHKALGEYKKLYISITGLIDSLINQKTKPDRLKEFIHTEVVLPTKMINHIDKIYSAIHRFIIFSDFAIRRTIEAEGGSFLDYINQYKLLVLSQEEKDKIDAIDVLFNEFILTTVDIQNSHLSIDTQLEIIEEVLDQLDRILDNEILPMIHDNLSKSAQDTRHSVNQAIGLLLFFLFMGIFIGVIIYLNFSQYLIQSIQKLVDGASAIGQGDYKYKVFAKNDDEFLILATSFNNMSQKLFEESSAKAQSEQDLKKLLAENRHLTQKVFVSIEDERQRLARDLHDEMGQSITAIKLAADFIQIDAINTQTKLIEQAVDIQNISDALTTTMRRIINDLRPSILDSFGLIDTFNDTITNWKRQNPDVACVFNHKGDFSEIPDLVSTYLYRILQEGLTNVSKHAAKANLVEVFLKQITELHNHSDMTASWINEIIYFQIRDNASGLADNPETVGAGLPGMRERVYSLGGTFQIKPGESSWGMTIEIRLPLRFKYQGENRVYDKSFIS